MRALLWIALAVLAPLLAAVLAAPPPPPANAQPVVVPGGYTADAPLLPSGEHIYFSLATLCEAVPPTVADSSAASQPLPELLEDDWRQIEFVHASNHDHVHSMLQALATFTQQKSVKGGYAGIYIRQEFPRPIEQSGLTLEALHAAFPSVEFIPTLRIQSGEAVTAVTGGFAGRVMGLGWLYGYEARGAVHALGLLVDRSSGMPSPEAITGLREFSRANKLLLVDWYVQVVVPQDVSAWLRGWKRGTRR